jgi:penicillin-binding protein 2
MRGDSIKYKTTTRRAFFVLGTKFLLFSSLAARFFYLQKVEAKRYSTLSENNRINVQYYPSLRGKILDRIGVVLADNTVAYQLTVQSYKLENIKDTINRVNQILNEKINLSDTELKKKIRKSFMRFPIVLVEKVSWDDLSRIESVSFKFPEVSIVKYYERMYPFNDITGHITGYTSKPNDNDLSGMKVPNIHEFTIGRNGLEKECDNSLRGTPAVRKNEVDSRGRRIRLLISQESAPGTDLNLGLDMRIQEFVYEKMAGKSGAVVVMDIENGNVLSLYSAPSYNPNQFIGGISKQHWETLLNNEQKPLINKAISMPYPPGSTFKPVSALTLLEAGVSPEESIVCTGKYRVGNRIFHCWKRSGHGKVNFEKSLSQSCNVYYYKMAERLSINDIYRIANKQLGLGELTGIELPYENEGIVPNTSWKKHRFNQEWHHGDTVNTVIGQGYLSVTPIQLVTMLARIVSGKKVRPSLIKSSPEFQDLAVKHEHLDRVREAMFAVYNKPSGISYARRFPYKDFQISGKTGTAQVASIDRNTHTKLQDHGLFMGFAPYHRPKFALAVVIEHGSWGSRSAAPIARSIFHKLYEVRKDYLSDNDGL